MPSTTAAEVAAFELGGQDVWPLDAQLFQPYEVEQILLPDNANCLAVQAYLKMCGLPFSVEMRWNAEWMSPSGRVPFLRLGPFLVAGLEGAAEAAAERGALPGTPLSPSQRADLRAYVSAVNVLFNAELYVCWLDPTTFKKVTAPRYGSVFPWPLGVLQTRSKREKVLKHLKLFKWSSLKLDEVLSEVSSCCKALSMRLGDQEFFFGNTPSELDALVFGHVFAILTTNLPCSQLAQVVQQYPALVGLVARIEAAYFKKK